MLQYTIIGNEGGESNIVVFVAGQAPQVASESHPNFEKIVQGALTGDDNIIELFDVDATVAQKFQRLSDRVTTANGRLYLDGEEVNNALAEQVLRFLDQGVEDWKPLIAFYENIQANPVEHSREQLYSWLAAHDFTITTDGMIVGYKGVYKQDDGTYLSVHSGKAIVDGEVVKGRIPTNPGSIVEMPRSEVEWNPSSACSTGLHVGTFDYASRYGNVLLEVHVNPRDVVSVPSDASGEKVRTCRYNIVREIENPYYSALIFEDEFTEDEYDGPDANAWGDGEVECEAPVYTDIRQVKPYDFETDAANGPSLGLQCSEPAPRLYDGLRRRIGF